MTSTTRPTSQAVPFAKDGLTAEQVGALRAAVKAAVGPVVLTFVSGESDIFGF